MIIFVMCIVSSAVTFFLSRLERELKYHVVILFVVLSVPIIHVLARGEELIPMAFLVACFTGMLAEYIYNSRYKQA